MLTRNCPNLEELGVEGSSSVPTDIHCLVGGRWPTLKKLSLGDVCWDWFPRSSSPGEKRPFVAFLEAHEYLASISLSRHTIQPIHLSTLSPESLSGVTSFSGTHQQLQALPHLHSSLKSVTFRDPVETREVSSITVASLLRDITSLTELKVSFTLHSMYDSGNLLRSLVQACPNLRHLDLTCEHKPSFHLDAFTKVIRSGLPKLRTFSLSIVKYPGEETLASGAARIAQSNPRLQKFSLAFLPPVYSTPLPFSLSFPSFPFPSHESGSFEISCDQYGLPLNLTAHENRQRFWPWGLGVSTRTKKYVKDLRPLSSPGRRKQGVRGFMNLIFEKSSAGEEMRMIIFCGFLVCLAVWGFTGEG